MVARRDRNYSVPHGLDNRQRTAFGNGCENQAVELWIHLFIKPLSFYETEHFIAVRIAHSAKAGLEHGLHRSVSGNAQTNGCPSAFQRTCNAEQVVRTLDFRIQPTHVSNPEHPARRPARHSGWRRYAVAHQEQLRALVGERRRCPMKRQAAYASNAVYQIAVGLDVCQCAHMQRVHRHQYSCPTTLVSIRSQPRQCIAYTNRHDDVRIEPPQLADYRTGAGGRGPDPTVKRHPAPDIPMLTDEKLGRIESRAPSEPIVHLPAPPLQRRENVPHPSLDSTPQIVGLRKNKKAGHVTNIPAASLSQSPFVVHVAKSTRAAHKKSLPFAHKVHAGFRQLDSNGLVLHVDAPLE